MRAALVIALGLLLAGCVSVDVDASLTCGKGLKSTTTAELVFGRNIGAVPGVSDADWQAFLDQEVTPRFPEGLTVVDTAGQWRNANGAVVSEASKVLTVILTDEDADRDKLDAIRTAYKTRFKQDAVLLIERSACVGF